MADHRLEDEWWSHRLTLAGFGRRIGAGVVDVLLVLGVAVVGCWLARGFDELARRQLNEVLHGMVPTGVSRQGLTKIAVLAALMQLVYGAAMEHAPWSGTFGKWLCGIRVVDEFGEHLTLTAAIVRNLVKLVSLAALGIGFFAAFIRPSRQAWHDRAAGSFVARG